MRQLLITSICIILTSTVFGQWFIETGVGYAIPTNKNSFIYDNIIIIDDQVNNTYNKESLSNKFSIIQSPTFNIMSGYSFQKIQLSIGFTYSDNKTISNLNVNNSYYRDRNYIWTNEDDVNIFTIKEFDNYSYFVRGYQIFPEISYLFKTKQITIKPLIGISFKFLTIDKVNTTTTSTSNDSNIEQDSTILVNNYKLLSKNSFNNLFGLRTGVSLLYDINTKFSISCNLIYNHSGLYHIYEKVLTSCEREHMGQIETIDIDNYSYYSNEAFNVNNINLSLGIRYTFDCKTKNGK